MHRVAASLAREKKAERAKGAAARPLDGGALTRVGSACAGEGAGNGAMSLGRRRYSLR